MKTLVVALGAMVALVFGSMAAGAERTAPSAEFLNAELYVSMVAGEAPGPSGFTVAQIIAAMVRGQQSWKPQPKGRWILHVTGTDAMTGRRQVLSMLFAPTKADAKDGVVILRMTANRQEVPQEVIFELVRRAAIQLDEQQKPTK